MKATIEFDLPEDTEDLDTALAAQRYRSTLWDLEQWLRNKLKYEQLTPEQDKAYQECRDQLHELLNENNVTLT